MVIQPRNFSCNPPGYIPPSGFQTNGLIPIKNKPARKVDSFEGGLAKELNETQFGGRDILEYRIISNDEPLLTAKEKKDLAHGIYIKKHNNGNPEIYFVGLRPKNGSTLEFEFEISRRSEVIKDEKTGDIKDVKYEKIDVKKENDKKIRDELVKWYDAQTRFKGIRELRIDGNFTHYRGVNGKKIKTVWTQPDKTLKMIDKFDEDGETIIEKQSVSLNPDGTVRLVSTYIGDKIDNSTLKSRISYEYVNGQIKIHDKEYNVEENGETYKCVERKVIKKDNEYVTEKESFHKTEEFGNVDLEIEYKNGKRTIGREIDYSTGTSRVKKEYSYDNAGNVIKTATFSYQNNKATVYDNKTGRSSTFDFDIRDGKPTVRKPTLVKPPAISSYAPRTPKGGKPDDTSRTTKPTKKSEPKVNTEVSVNLSDTERKDWIFVKDNSNKITGLATHDGKKIDFSSLSNSLTETPDGKTPTSKYLLDAMGLGGSYKSNKGYDKTKRNQYNDLVKYLEENKSNLGIDQKVINGLKEKKYNFVKRNSEEGRKLEAEQKVKAEEEAARQERFKAHLQRQEDRRNADFKKLLEVRERRAKEKADRKKGTDTDKSGRKQSGGETYTEKFERSINRK